MLKIRWWNPVSLFIIAAWIAATGSYAHAADPVTAKLDREIPLRWREGPISFGLVLAGQVVSWSDPAANDLLISRCWEGVYLYPSRNLTSAELNGEPIKLCPSFTEITMGQPVDWNHDGKDELIVSNRRGFFFLLDRQGKYPRLTFPAGRPERDSETDLEFNIPYENPNHPKTSSQGGYLSPNYSNYTYPIPYPSFGDKVDLIFGDRSGVLWWLPDQSDGKSRPAYSGIRYPKSDGKECSKPADKICGESGVPFLLGEGREGEDEFPGGNTRPVVFRNPITHSADLLVLAGTMKQQVFYLKKVDSPTDGKPVFRNMGEVRFEGEAMNHPGGIMNLGFHTRLIVIPSPNDTNDLFVSNGCQLAYYRNMRPDNEMPEYQFSHYISAKDAQACLACPTEILKDRQGHRYLLDNTGVDWKFFRIETERGKVRLAWPGIPLLDQNGVFKVEAETDAVAWKVWGYHRAARWDFDGSGRQHLIVGTDKGLLHLLMEDEHSMEAPTMKFHSVGPLADSSGRVIRVHNRAMGGGIDLNSDGRDDLIVGGSPYQLGTHSDPSPTGGFYYLINKGLDKDGLPILEPMKPLPIEGYQFDVPKNTHVQIHIVDLDNDGAREVVLASQRPDVHGRVFRLMKDRIGLEFAGKVLPGLSIRRRLADLDDDGQLELICGGGEHGIGWYCEFAF